MKTQIWSLQVEEPKAAKGLSSMLFTVYRWKEVAIGDKKSLKNTPSCIKRILNTESYQDTKRHKIIIKKQKRRQAIHHIVL
jgi:hypothetical protein